MAQIVALRATVLWVVIRLAVAVVPLAAGEAAGSISPSPVAVVLLCGVVGLIDVRVRGERVLWANLGIRPRALFVAYAVAAIVCEVLLMVARG